MPSDMLGDTACMQICDRADRVRALARVRLDPGGSAESDRLAARLGHVTALQKLADAHPGDAARQTDLSEALALTRPAEAKRILEDLAAHDLVTTPYGYVTLARLRAADGDGTSQDEALARCRPMAKSASICALYPSPFWLARVAPVAAVAVAAAALGALAGAVRRARARRPRAA